MNSIAQRRLDERERRRTEIVDAADALARDLGWDTLTVDGVAKRARLSRALVYLYFKDKTDLHAAIWERAKDDLLQRFSTAVEATELAGCRVEAIGRAYIRFAEEQPHYFEALSRFEAMPEEPEVEGDAPSPARQRQDDVHQLIVGVLSRGQELGVVRADCGNLDLTAVSLWAFTHGLIQISTGKRSYLAGRGVAYEALLEQAFSMLRRTISREG